MTIDPDRPPPSPVQAAAQAAATNIGRVWQYAFVQGVREGMEVSAKITELTLDGVKHLDGTDAPQAFLDSLAVVLGNLRDRIRTEALGVPDPKPYTFQPEPEYQAPTIDEINEFLAKREGEDEDDDD